MTLIEAWPYNLPYVHKGWKTVKMSDLAAMIGGIDDEKAMTETIEHAGVSYPYPSFCAGCENPGKTPALNDAERRFKFINWLLARPPDYTPGTKFSYSNFGYGIIGAVLEKEWAKKHKEPHPKG